MIKYKRVNDIWMGSARIYSCNHRKNKECKKNHCQYVDSIEPCTHTTNWKYAKRTPLNYIKRLINIIRGRV